MKCCVIPPPVTTENSTGLVRNTVRSKIGVRCMIDRRIRCRCWYFTGNCYSRLYLCDGGRVYTVISDSIYRRFGLFFRSNQEIRKSIKL